MKTITVLFLSAALATFAFAAPQIPEDAVKGESDALGIQITPDIINLAPSGEAATDDSRGDDPGYLDTGDTNPPSCTISYCGTPTETESNGTCATFDAHVLVCDDIVYGYLCSTLDDHDYYKVIIPSMKQMTIRIYDGENCTTNQTNNIQARLYNSSCIYINDSDSRVGWTLRNETGGNVTYYVKVWRRSSSSSNTRYKIVTTCCTITNYCQTPLVVTGIVPGDNYFYALVNTCCATNPVDSVYYTGCSGTKYGSGPDVIFILTLPNDGTIDSLKVCGELDNQVLIFTDCAHPRQSCVAGADKAYANGHYAGATETLYNLPLPAGTYYISLSGYPSDACGDICLKIWLDEQLPVELLSFETVAGDGQVTVNWRTGSEPGNTRFEILRNQQLGAQINGYGSATGNTYSWTDNGLHNGLTYTYTLIEVNENGGRSELATQSAMPTGTAVLTSYALFQNYPNPFNPETSIGFDLVESGHVDLTIYNLNGQMVETLVNGVLPAGHRSVTFNAAGLPSGVYLYRLQANGFVDQKKMVLLK